MSKELERLYECVNLAFQVDIKTKKRNREVQIPKQVFCYLATRNCIPKDHNTIHAYGLKNIGKYVEQDYTCVIHNKRVIEDLLSIGEERTIKAVNKAKKMYVELLKQYSETL